MIDSTHGSVPNVPLSTTKVAGYVTGSPDIQWTTADWARFPKASKVRIDQAPGGHAFATGGAEVLDVENGAATIANAVAGVLERQKKNEYSTIYISQSNLTALQDALRAAKAVMNRVGFWVANWSLSETEAAAALGNELVAIQYASPTSNPLTIIPGGTMTLRQANVDLSVTLSSWYPPPAPPPAWQKTALNLASEGQVVMNELVNILRAHQ
jgi:hypothetical protein